MIRHRTKILIAIVTIYVVLAAGALWWVIYSIDTAGKTLGGHVQVIADQLAKEKTFSDLRVLSEDTAEQRDTLTNFVLTEEQTIAFLTSIEAVGLAQGVELKTDTLKVNEKDGAFNNLEVSLTISGDATQVLKMVEILEVIPYHSQLQLISFSQKNNQKDADMKASLVVSIASS